MKKFAMGLVAVLCAGGLAACGGGGGDDIDAFMKLDTAKGEAFAVGGDDCVAKAKSVREWRTKHNAEYKAAQAKLKEKFKEGPPPDVKAKYGDQMKKNNSAVMDAMMKCTNKPEFDAAIDETK
ncbi:MAG: hypothetical protein AB7O24_16780 [Kofleriaceae bacterium]